MEWINPQNLPNGDENQQQILTFDMLRALIAARQAASPHMSTMHDTSMSAGMTGDDSHNVRQIFATGGQVPPTTGQFAAYRITKAAPETALPPAAKTGQNDA